MEQTKSYQQILKSTSLFGGVQVFTIIISVVKSKFIAILLGASGMGVVGLFTTTTDLVSSLTSFGLSRSAVKNIAAANTGNNEVEISQTVTVLRRLIWFTGSLGAVMMFLFAKYLSELTFGNDAYHYAFQWLSITLLFNQISESQIALLRGMRRLKSMAKCTLWGSVIGLFVSIPIYYFLGQDGIVPAIIISSVAALLISFYYSRQLKIKNAELPREKFEGISKEMLRIGSVLTLSTAFVLGSSYLIRIYILAEGSLDEVGFYNAGFTIVNTYFGLIFISLTTDYYPKLAAIAQDNIQAIHLMNQQSEMTILIIAPVLTIFLIFVNLIILILYTKEFLTIGDMILWAALGIYLKAASWSLGVIFISKGDVKFILISELVSSLFLTIFSITGYYYYGLEGLGIAFFLGFLSMFLMTFLIVRFKYSFKYTNKFYLIFAIHFLIGISAFIIARYSDTNIYRYSFGFILIGLSTGYSVYRINKLMNLRSLISSFLKRKK